MMLQKIILFSLNLVLAATALYFSFSALKNIWPWNNKPSVDQKGIKALKSKIQLLESEHSILKVELREANKTIKTQNSEGLRLYEKNQDLIQKNESLEARLQIEASKAAALIMPEITDGAVPASPPTTPPKKRSLIAFSRSSSVVGSPSGKKDTTETSPNRSLTSVLNPGFFKTASPKHSQG